MKCLILFALIACACAHPFEGLTKEQLNSNVWVVLAAGSDGWYNYRHQADVCHMYQVAHTLGVPDERIIMFHVDDIANNPSNPRKGVIINEPNGPNVYNGVPKDYTGRDVTGANFLKVLEGTNPGVGSGKILESGSQDYVFVFFDDHGTHGALCFPEGCTVTGAKFESTLQVMSQKKMFKELVVYVEACYAGSVFVNKKIPPNVYITTASPPGASSFGYNWDSTVSAYVADIYSYLFMHDLDINPITRTFNDQFDYMQDNIQNYSMVCQYGDIEYGKEKMSSFWKASNTGKNTGTRKVKITDAVQSWDVQYHTIRRVAQENPTEENLIALKKETKFRDRVDQMASNILDAMDVPKHLTLPPCTTCSSVCTCYQYCGGSADFCRDQCCDQQGCYKPVANKWYDPDQHDVCTTILVNRFLERCGNDHPYLRSVDAKINRACRAMGAKIHEAIKWIDAECARN